MRSEHNNKVANFYKFLLFKSHRIKELRELYLMDTQAVSKFVIEYYTRTLIE
jgi:hypothetical protein